MRHEVQTAWRGGDAIQIADCPACGGASARLYARAVIDNFRPDDADLWTFWRCDSCGSLYPNPRPSTASIGKAYAGYYTHQSVSLAQNSGASSFPLLGALVNGYMNRRFGARLSGGSMLGWWLFRLFEPLRLKLDYHGRHLFLTRLARGRVLDVGSGNGEFLRRATDMGWEAVGLDPDPDAVKACVAAGLTAVEGFASADWVLSHGPFDVVTLRHSIEHTPVPNTDLQHCLRYLRPGGMIWLAWPNPQGLGANVYRSTWRGLEAPRHLIIPTAKAMRLMLQKAGYMSPRLLRRGHHARSIIRASSQQSRTRPGWINRIRSRIAVPLTICADIAASLSPLGGEELVMVAWAPLER